MERTLDSVRLGVVLSAGGLRGAAHVGVLRQLVRHAIPIDVMVGVSAGAVIATYYAAVGLDLDDLIADARAFRGRHLLLHGLNLHLGGRFDRALSPRCGIIPDRLRQLETARFDHLHHGIRALGIVCHDVAIRRPRYFATGCDHGASLHDVARASASIPYLFAPLPVACEGEQWRLTDGGLSDAVPLAFARRPPLNATHLIVSDCRWIGGASVPSRDMVWIRPRMTSTGTLWGPRHGLLSAVMQGEAAVTEEIIGRIRAWLAPATRNAPDTGPVDVEPQTDVSSRLASVSGR
jgi:predicted acylesterase/phospholipase RssA